MSHGRLQLFVLASCFFALAATIGVADEVDPTLRSDAQLADVCFVDAEHGWAVGDRGTIWRTEDGGAHWRLQCTNVDCRLAAVCFLDNKTGWAAGGYTHPYTHVTTGVVLRTRDGGEKWTYDRQALIPAIRAIQFFDAAHGCATGQQSTLFPAGVFTTDDGGRSWASLPPADESAWLAGDFSDPLTGVVVGRSGAVAAVRRKAIERSSGADLGLRSVHRVKLASPLLAWLIGDGGLVMHSDDAGHSWQTPPTEVPADVRSQFDFSALAVRGDKLWAAGSPGTRVLHSPDGGHTWTVQATGHNMPIRAITFLDDQHGWAVGDLGTVIATQNGGQTWRLQRSGGARAAVLGVFSEAGELPLELFAKLSGDEGYLGVAAILNRADVEVRSPGNIELPGRIHESFVRAGGSVADTAWRFPLRQSGLALSSEQLIESWNRANDGHALERLDEHLVRTLRIWRPEVVVTTLTTARKSDPQAQLINQLVLRAVEHAADPTMHAEQISAAGLTAWKTKKVFGSLAPGDTGSANITTAQATRTGRSIADLAAPARGLIDCRYTPSPTNVGFRLLIDHLPQDVGQRDFFSGIPLSPGGDARRMLVEAPTQLVDNLRRSSQARRNLQAILARHDDRGSDGRYLAEVSELTRTMDNSHAAEVLLQLADRYHHHGQWQMAADTYDMVVERYPQHPAAGAALVWLVQYYASGEVAWRVNQRQQITSEKSEIGSQKAAGPERFRRMPLGASSGALAGESELRAPHRDVQRASAVVTLTGNGDDRPARAAGYAKQLEQCSPALFAEPQVRFPLAAANRQQGYPRQAERFYLGFVRSRSHNAWWACAQAEVQRTEDKDQSTRTEESRRGKPEPSAKPIWRCARSGGKPRLDGKLDDAIWHIAQPVELKSLQRDDDTWPAIAMLAYDNEFLYLAVSCQQLSGSRPTPALGPRPRDGDLTQQDRVELYLDLDRDYATAYRFVIDARGWTNDSCWGDPTWNPQWFVAAINNDESKAGHTWTAEAAIPLSELTAQRPAPNHLWSAGIQRIVPNAGFQSWTTPAAVEVQPEGRGLLIFE